MLGAAFHQAWPPFVLVAALLLIGTVAHSDGSFQRLAVALEAVPGPPLVLYVLSAMIVAVITAFLNLDTAVVFITPLVVLAARHRGLAEEPFLYAALVMANASSLYLPGSNLTNLLVHPGGAFAARMLAPALVATFASLALLMLRFGPALLRAGAAGGFGHPGGETSLPAAQQQARLLGPGLVAAILAAAAMVILAQPGLVVLALAVLAAATALLRRELHVRDLLAALSPHVLGALFAVSVGLGVLARAWHGPATLMTHASVVETALIATGACVVVNNLPAAVLLSAQRPAHPQALLIGLNLGPNLAVTGSLAAFLWFKAARQVGLAPSVRTLTGLGLLIAPASIALSLAAAV